MIKLIKIEQVADARGRWRAFCYVPAYLSYALNVFGEATENGPWCEGFGPTPDQALVALQQVLGAALLSATQIGETP